VHGSHYEGNRTRISLEQSFLSKLVLYPVITAMCTNCVLIMSACQ